jgi:hypothetical protein
MQGSAGSVAATSTTTDLTSWNSTIMATLKEPAAASGYANMLLSLGGGRMLNIIRGGLLSMLVFTWAVPAHAVILLSEGWEGECSEVKSRWTPASFNSGGLGFPCEPGVFGSTALQPYFLDSTVKLFGSQSLRYNFVGSQYDGWNKSGGYTDRDFTPTSEIWITYYNRMSGGFQVAGGGGVSGVVTKGLYTFMRSPTKCVVQGSGGSITQAPCGSPGALNQINGWSSAYMWGGRQMVMGAQGIKDAPTPYSTQTLQHNIQVFNQPDNKWICYEWHFKLNTPGQANGLYEQYATNVTDGGPAILTTRYMNREFLGATPNDIMPSDAQWFRMRNYRQDGLGQMWYDNQTVSTTRIGCTGGGNTAPSDTKAPAGPIGLVAN